MKDIILQALKKNKIENYLIRGEETESAELYFIKRELDMRRIKNIVSYEVTAYRDFEKDGKKMRGFSAAKIFPQMSPDDVERAVADAYYAASFAANPYFELPAGEKKNHVPMSGKLASLSVEQAAEAFVKALYEADCREDAWINTAEFFVNKRRISICNSRGIDVSYTRCQVNGEFVVQCVTDGKESKETAQSVPPQDVEQYQDFSYNDLDTEALTAQAKEALDAVSARARAVEAPPKGNYDIILSGKQMRTIFSFYASRANAQMVYPGYSTYQKGTKVQGEDVTGEKVNMALKATVPYSYEGIPMKDTELIREGELQTLYGNVRFCGYLGIQPTGLYEAFHVANGTRTMEELKSSPYLHVVSFSDFQMDDFSGNFGGEIRLAYLYDGEKVVPVTGGSVNGNFLELQKNMVFSKETYRDGRYEGPLAVRFCGVPVAGA